MNARDYALLELDSRSLPHWAAGSISTAKLKQAWPDRTPPANPRDRALSEQLIVGVIKNLLRLQHLIEHFSGRRLDDISPPLQKIVAIALYQLDYLDRIPPSAAVNEAVAQTHRIASRKAAGFVNAVLRNAVREPRPKQTLSDFPSPSDYARLILSHPPELFSRLDKQLGVTDALRFCEHDNRPPPILVRLSPNIDPAFLASPGVALTPHEQPGWFVTDAKRSQLAAWADAGVAFVQDPTAGLAAIACDVHPGQRLLDRCCGLGTKTLQLRQLLGDTGIIVAMDPNAPRIGVLRRYLADHHLMNIHLHQNAWLTEIADPLPEGKSTLFDRILIDAPCSNSGVLARRPEARYAQSPAAMRSLSNLQDRLLEATAPFLSPRGLLLYSTCSIWPEENDHRIAPFLTRHRGFQLIRQQITLPSFDEDPTRYRDGGYFAVIGRQP